MTTTTAAQATLATAMFSVSDQDAALAFYTGLLGWELRGDTRFGPQGEHRWIEVAPPGSIARLALNPPMGGTPGGAAIGVEVADVLAEHARLSAVGGIDLDPSRCSWRGPRRCSRCGTPTATTSGSSPRAEEPARGGTSGLRPPAPAGDVSARTTPAVAACCGRARPGHDEHQGGTDDQADDGAGEVFASQPTSPPRAPAASCAASSRWCTTSYSRASRGRRADEQDVATDPQHRGGADDGDDRSSFGMARTMPGRGARGRPSRPARGAGRRRPSSR
jgi:catechol 2,3-dioxygenase-like lactoylglutathione lyase family enzyme